MSENRPSFIKIAHGAKVKGLTMDNNLMVGDGDFLKNEGELEDAILINNKHMPFASSGHPPVPKKNWYEKPAGQIFIGVVIVVVGGGVLVYFGWN